MSEVIHTCPKKTIDESIALTLAFLTTSMTTHTVNTESGLYRIIENQLTILNTLRELQNERRSQRTDKYKSQ
jgi:hypothetical protein